MSFGYGARMRELEEDKSGSAAEIWDIMHRRRLRDQTDTIGSSIEEMFAMKKMVFHTLWRALRTISFPSLPNAFG